MAIKLKNRGRQYQISNCSFMFSFSPENRHRGATRMNDKSSRSHAIFRVVSLLNPNTSGINFTTS